MIVSYSGRLVLLSMTKCASHALIAAFGTRADLVISGPPGLKHCNFRKYNRLMRKFLQTASDEPFETACLFREPVDWLHSWWRYRQRPALAGHPNSTEGLDFDSFVLRHLDEEAPAANFGRQSRFVSDGAGGVGVDHLFRYDEIGRYLAFIQDRTGWDAPLERLNVSPVRDAPQLAETTRARLEAEYHEDFRIYRAIPAAGN